MYSPLQPIAICQHDATQGPAYLQTFLDQHGLPYQIFAVNQGDDAPVCSKDYAAVVVLGSNASVNQPLHWIRREEQLLADAIARHKPILGHCFGGQLLAKVLGAEVRPNMVPHIGWDKVQRTLYPEARYWLGEQQDLFMFHWHFETFQIPKGAKRLLFGQYCLNKAFAFGPHLALQSHLEVTAESVRNWCRQDHANICKYAHLNSVQSEACILAELHSKVSALHQTSNKVYRRWLQQIPAMQPQLQCHRQLAL